MNTQTQLQPVEPWLPSREEIEASEQKAVQVATPAPAPIQGNIIAPLRDVRAYLDSRRACTHFRLADEEQALFVTLPSEVREELEALLGKLVGSECAFSRILALCEETSLHQACKRVARIYSSTWNWSPERLRARLELYLEKKDWTVLVNKAKAGLAWQTFKPGSERGLPEVFLKFVETRVGEFQRSSDGMRQAIISIHRQWRTGLNPQDELEAIPGFGFWYDWFHAKYPNDPEPQEPPLPHGWGYENLRAILQARLPKAVRKMVHESTAAAKPFLPSVLRTRAQLRFMEEVTFDDLKLDYRVIDPETGEICDMWILLARCTGTGTWLGFVQRPAKARDDGTQEHLNLRDMKQISGLLLEKFPLPPYQSTWKLERGTATLSQGQTAALEEMLPGSIKFSYNSVIGGKSSAGYKQKAKGNSNSKPGHESTNRLVHTMSAAVPGQTGPHYSKRPADLKAREDEAVTIWKTVQLLPPDQRGRAQYPILTIAQSRAHLFKVLRWMNSRTDHRLEGFDEVVEWYDTSSEPARWRHQAEQPEAGLPAGVQVRTRLESPYERAAKLIKTTLATGEKFNRVSPDIIAAFFKHSQRFVTVNTQGEVKIEQDRKSITFRPAGVPMEALVPGTEYLAHLNEEDPAYLYCTNGKGAIIGIWVRRDRCASHDELVEHLRYSQEALSQAKAHAEELGAPERARLEAMRANNSKLLGEFITVTDPTQVEAASPTKLLTSDSATVMATTNRHVKRAQAEEKQHLKKVGTKAADAFLSGAAEEKPVKDAGGDFLKALS